MHSVENQSLTKVHGRSCTIMHKLKINMQMKNFFNTIVSFVPHNKSNNVSDVTLWDCLWTIPIKKLWKIKQVRNEQEEKVRTQLKESLPAFFPSCTLKGGTTVEHIQEHTGFICIDIDIDPTSDEPKKNPHADPAEVKAGICTIPNVAYCARSVSGKGFFCLIPIADPDRHLDYFYSLQADFRRCGIVIDGYCKNVNRKRFISYDPEPYVNTGAEIYERVLPPPPPPKYVKRRPAKAAGDDLEVLHNHITANRIDITGDYGQWFSILCSIYSELGEAGEDYAYDISQYSKSFKEPTFKMTWRNVCKYGAYKHTIATLFYYAKQAGINLSACKDFKDINV